ncbi:hypothetical protein W97_06236 [Coniosporium apollinis CBS 100218]|uniref:Uncharacterized protein n=1 Tax=Coniosporium apollinis (strain CBS 100218) TaxID=1168221 RepID=R7YYH0_CONA1|nr:uncharacterized protein W97_06236 [Coniosporium apollinis CBS 100218]EON66834.1 hypothetical protein W97_06236 [Coniosporium apollinis CBS 100218]
MSNSATAAQHDEVMATLRLIQATQKDILERVERAEHGPAGGPNLTARDDLEAQESRSQELRPEEPRRQEPRPSEAIQERPQSEVEGREKEDTLTAPESPVRKRPRLMTYLEVAVQYKFAYISDALMQIRLESNGAQCSICKSRVTEDCFFSQHVAWCLYHKHSAVPALANLVEPTTRCLHKESGYKCQVVQCDLTRDEYDEKVGNMERVAGVGDGMRVA